MHEVNSNDMMQNTGIFYHPESIPEFQFLCLLVAWLTLGKDIPDHFLENQEFIGDIKKTINGLFVCNMIEHVTCIAIEKFRRYDIDKHGK